MDFFETQERYRRREMRGWLVLFVRMALILGALWVGWLWGQAEQSSLQAEADQVIYQNNVRITELSTEVQKLQRELAETRADGAAKLVTGDDNVALRRVIARKIATGVTSEKIILSIQSLEKLENCRELARNDVAVATPLYAGPESKLTLFGGGLNLSVEGSTGKQAQRDTPWFDPTLPISVRHVFLGGQKTISGSLPVDAIIPTEDWILKLRYEKADILGYVTAIVSSCTMR